MAQTWDVTTIDGATGPPPASATSYPFRLHVIVTLPNGQEYRWSPDERLAANQPSGLSFSTTVPGGFSTCTFTLPRDVVKDYPDEALFADVRVVGAGGRVAWEGRVASLPREQGSSRSVTVGAVGWSAHLKDNAAFREIYVDRDLGRWQGPSAARRAALHAANQRATGGEKALDGLELSFPVSSWAAAYQPSSELWYDAAKVPVGSVYYSWSTVGNTNTAGMNWAVFALTDDVATAYDTSGNLKAAGPGTGTLAATARNRSWAAVQFNWSGGAAAGTENEQWVVKWDTLKVYGAHDMTLRGTEPNAGFYLSDIVRNVIPRAAPLLTLGDIETTSYVIPQAAYLQPTDAESVLMDGNKYELMRMAVWEDRRFNMWRASADTRTVWEARLSEGAQLQLEGDNADSVANGVIVQYTDPYGQPRVIGPTGYTPADTTSSSLLISDTTNAATAAGIQKYITLSLSFPTDASGAEQIGAVFLREQNLPQRRGTVNLAGLVQHPTDGKVPCWRVRAGDFLRVADRPNDPPREITQTSYGHDGHTVSCSVGGLPNSTEALLERVGIKTLNA